VHTWILSLWSARPEEKCKLILQEKETTLAEQVSLLKGIQDSTKVEEWYNIQE
jgi:hypothetical protein